MNPLYYSFPAMIFSLISIGLIRNADPKLKLLSFYTSSVALILLTIACTLIAVRQ